MNLEADNEKNFDKMFHQLHMEGKTRSRGKESDFFTRTVHMHAGFVPLSPGILPGWYDAKEVSASVPLFVSVMNITLLSES